MPRFADHRQRRAYIIAAARRILARDGLGGLTMRAIAAEAGCTTGLVTHYFASKEELIGAAVAATAALQAERAWARLGPDAAPGGLPASVAAGSSPAAGSAVRTPAAGPAVRTPAAVPAERTPKTAPSERAPTTAPPERTPTTAPSERTPEAEPSERAPEAELAALEELLPIDRERADETRVWLAFYAQAVGNPDLLTRHEVHYADWRRTLAQVLTGLGATPGRGLDAAVDRLVIDLSGLALHGVLDAAHWTPERQVRELRTIVDDALRAAGVTGRTAARTVADGAAPAPIREPLT